MTAHKRNAAADAAKAAKAFACFRCFATFDSQQALAGHAKMHTMKKRARRS